jgi:hypothetical protein
MQPADIIQRIDALLALPPELCALYALDGTTGGARPAAYLYFHLFGDVLAQPHDQGLHQVEEHLPHPSRWSLL